MSSSPLHYSVWLKCGLVWLCCAEWAVSTSHGCTGGPRGMCEAPAPAQGARWWRHLGLLDGPPRCCPLWPLPCNQASPGQESQPERQSPGNAGPARVRWTQADPAGPHRPIMVQAPAAHGYRCVISSKSAASHTLPAHFAPSQFAIK